MQILFNKTIDQCRIIGGRGGRTRARNLRLLKLREVPRPAQTPVVRIKLWRRQSRASIINFRGSTRRSRNGAARRCPRDARSFVGSEKRGRVCWYRCTWRGKAIRESTKQSNKRLAEQMVAAHKTSLSYTARMSHAAPPPYR
jgi:hypothetical protein